MTAVNEAIFSDHKFTGKELAYIKSEMKKDGYKFDAFYGKFSKKENGFKSYCTQAEAYARIAKYTVLAEIRTLLFQNGIKPTIANTGTLYIKELDVRISNHSANGYFHAEKFGLNKHDFVVGAFTNPNDVLNSIKSLIN
jgi:hypothetical protein